MMSLVLYCLFAPLLLIGAFMAVVSRNSVRAVLCLVLAFFAASWVFLSLKAEFMSLLLIIIYVGAVAVLFLFVVMMLASTRQNLIHTPGRLLGLGVSTAIFFMLFKALSRSMLYGNDLSPPTLIPYLQFVKIYTNYNAAFQATGAILFVAMVGSIILCLPRVNIFVRKQSISAQITRSPKDCVTLMHPEVGKGVTL